MSFPLFGPAATPTASIRMAKKARFRRLNGSKALALTRMNTKQAAA